MLVALGSKGAATITMELQLAGAAPGAAVIGPTTNVTASNVIIPATGPWVESLSPGDYIVRARFADPKCPPQEFPLTMPDCPTVVCPDIDWSADISSECDLNGRRTVTVTATIVFAGRSIDASLLDRQGQIIASGTQTDDLTLVSPPLSLGGGDHDFSVEFNTNITAIPESCRPDLDHTVSVPDCPGGTTCPTVAWNPNVSANCNLDGTRDAMISATVSSFGTPITAELRDPQSNVLDTATTTANGTATLDSGAMTLTPGNHQFSVAFTAGLPRGCAGDDTNVVSVPDCNGGGNGGPESLGCQILRILGLLFLIVGLVAILGGVCSENGAAIGVGIAFAVVGMGALIAWALFCAPEVGCRMFQRLIGLIFLLILIFGVIALIVALIAAIAAILGGPAVVLVLPCALGALADAGILGILVTILFSIFVNRGCQWQGQNPFG
jgi:hypothetical protein